MKIRACILGLVFGGLVSSTFAQTVIQSWRMGEDDSAATNGNAANSTLTASVGTDLALSGSGLTYTTSIQPQSTDSLAVNFDGSGNYFVSSNLGLSTNFGMETWVNFSSTSGTQWIMLVGYGASAGTGILLTGGTIRSADSGNNSYGSIAPLANTWYHVALVVDENSSASLYWNGSLVDGTTFTATNSFAANFGLGADQSGAARLTGTLDDARVFTFATGTFNSSMLNYTAVPEPSTYAVIAGALALGLVAWRRRRV